MVAAENLPQDLVNVITQPLKVEWNPDVTAWGVWAADQFIPFTQ